MIDISDGLAGDLRHLLEMGGNLGAELLGSAIPISRTARLRAREGELAKPAMIAALTDGEDFELLFTVAARDAVPIMDGWRERFPDVRLSCIGRITAGPAAFIRDRHGVRELPPRGYEHFGH